MAIVFQGLFLKLSFKGAKGIIDNHGKQKRQGTFQLH